MSLKLGLRSFRDAEKGIKGYRFILTAVMFGNDAEDAFNRLIDAVRRDPEGVLDGVVEAEALDYVCLVGEEGTAEA